MGLAAVTETAQMFQQKNIVLTERDKEFVVQFAFRTNDRELTNKRVQTGIQYAGNIRHSRVPSRTGYRRSKTCSCRLKCTVCRRNRQ